MRYATFCSGIDAPRVAWEPLGWEQVFCSEIEPFPCAVLEHHAPVVPNLGDMTTITREDLEKHGPVELLCAGTPCQAFSVAGLRAGLAGPRGNLALEFLRLIGIARPRWVVWENVPGVLSSWTYAAPPCAPSEAWAEALRADGLDPDDFEEVEQDADFGCFIAGLQELGYGVAWRILDAQYVGLAQRRKRIFVVGYFGDWRGAAAVLLERGGLSGDPAPSRDAGEVVAGCLEARAGTGGYDPGAHGAASGHLIPTHEVAHTLQARDGKGNDSDATQAMVISHTLTSSYGATEDGTGQGYPAVMVNAQQDPITSEVAQPLDTFGNSQAVGVSVDLYNGQLGGDVAGTLRCYAEAGNQGQGVLDKAVRRLMPVELERLQGFPDDYTRISWRGKPAEECVDGPRCRAIGNSMAVPVMRWIGTRIYAVDKVMSAGVDL